MTDMWDEGGYWDSGLFWDGAEPIGDVTPYINLVTSEHIIRPNFIAWLTSLLQPLVDIIAVANQLPDDFDVDQAIGVQLDIVGLWVGVSRNLTVTLPNVYFSFDTEFLGFDQGSWFGPGSSTTGISTLPDDAYRILLKAKIIANQWDGTIPGAYAAWDALFQSEGWQVVIIDYEDMSMSLGIWGPPPDAITLALLENGELDLRPAGVMIRGYFVSSVWPAPFFGFDVSNDIVAGFDVGAWAIDVSALVPTVYLTSDSGVELTDDSGNKITAG